MTGSRAKDDTSVLARAAEWTLGLFPKVGTCERGRWVVGDKDELMSGCWCRGHVEISGSPLDFGAQRPAVRCGPGRGVRNMRRNYQVFLPKFPPKMCGLSKMMT